MAKAIGVDVGSNYFNDVSAKQCLSATSSNLYNDDRCSTGSYEVDLYFYSGWWYYRYFCLGTITGVY